MNAVPAVLSVLVALAPPTAPQPAASTVSASASAEPTPTPPPPPRPGLAQIPFPPLENLEPGDREQVQEERKQLDDLITAGKASDAELAAAYGRMGSLYLLYDLLTCAEPALANAQSLAPDDPAWPYYLGFLYRRDGRFEQADKSFSRAHELDPHDAPTLIRLGQVQLAEGELDGAGKSFRAVLAMQPNSAAALEGLGTIAQRQKRPRDAIELLAKALEIQPAANAIQTQLGMAYRDAGDLARAKEHLLLGHGKAVRFPDPRMDRLNSLLKGSAVHLTRGNNALKHGLLDVAMSEYRQALAISPNDPVNQYNMGVALIQAGRRDEAIAYFKKAIELDPGYRNAQYNLASALADEGQWAEAAEHYGKAAQIDPLDHAAHLDWAEALLGADELQRAAEVLRSLLGKLRPDETALAGKAELDLARVLERTGDEQTAVEHFRRAAGLLDDGAAAAAHTELAKLLGRLGRFSEAADELAQTVRLSPDDVGPRFGQAMALILGGRYVDARKALEADLVALPGNLVLSHLLARLLATAPDPAARDGAEAVKLAEDAFRRRATLEHAETVGMAYAEVGRFSDAVTLERRILGKIEPRGRPDVIARNRHWLELYEQGKPVRSPWKEQTAGTAQ